MEISKVLSALAALAMGPVLAGCITVDKSSFTEQPGQKVIVRSGMEAILSAGRETQLVVAPSSREETELRPTYVAMIRNISSQPVTFRYSDIRVTHMETGKPLKLWNVDELQSDARGRAFVGALLGGAIGAASGSYSGYGQVNGRNFSYSGYNSGVAAANASALSSAAATAGEINVAALENNMLQDNTILPGEVYGGAFVFDKPSVTDTMAPKHYVFTIKVGDDTHVVQVNISSKKIR